MAADDCGSGWRPSGGERIAEIGPLPVIAGRTYSAQYMEAIFTPGMVAPTRAHAGPEAWLLRPAGGRDAVWKLPGASRSGVQVARLRSRRAHPPMHLYVRTGTEQRRALVLILHDSTKTRDHARNTIGSPRVCARFSVVRHASCCRDILR